MTQQQINIGIVPNDRTGDPIRTAFQKVNSNFTDLDDRLIHFESANIITPDQFGAVGDGVADDGQALNLAFGALRLAAFYGNNPIKCPVLDGQGRKYRTTIPINATGINGFGWGVRDMTIVGAVAGKCVLDTIGTRGGCWDRVYVWGDKINRPTVGWQSARAASPAYLAFCDNQTFIKCQIDGFFTVAARYAYGQESCAYVGCQWWNRDSCGTTSIVVGSSVGLPAMVSDYLAPITGPTSAINNSYLRCEDRTAPWDGLGLWAISSISKSNPAVVGISSGHQLENGETVCISNGSGMFELDSYVGTIQNVTATSFELAGVDSTSFGTYSGSGGIAVRAQTKPTVIIGRLGSTTWHNHYVVNYGTDAYQFVFPDANDPVDLEFNLLVEGAPRSAMRFKAPGYDSTISGFRFNLQSQRLHEAVITIDGSTTGRVLLENGAVKLNDAPYTSRPLINTPGRFDLFNIDLVSPAVAEIYIYNFNSFVGTVAAADQTVKQYHGAYLREPTIYAPLFGDQDGPAWQIVDTTGSLIPHVNLDKSFGAPTKRVLEIWAFQLNLGQIATDGIIMRSGTAPPENTVSANPGSYYSQTGTTATLWFKKTGVGTNTGWVAVA